MRARHAAFILKQATNLSNPLQLIAKPAIGQRFAIPKSDEVTELGLQRKRGMGKISLRIIQEA